MPTDSLAHQIEETRITYPDRGTGVGVQGAPFVCEFDTSVDPAAVCDRITTSNPPWQLWGISTPLADDYRKLTATLFHIDDGELVDTSPLTLEIAPAWVRIYVKSGCSAARTAEFVQALDDEYGVTVHFASLTG